MRNRTIVGVQLHHSVNLDDASRNGVNALTSLEGAIVKTGDPSLVELRDQGLAWVREIGRRRTQAGERLRSMDPDMRREAVEGHIPYPDETVGGFVARCICNDRCLYHDQRVGTERDCNCGRVCGQHGETPD